MADLLPLNMISSGCVARIEQVAGSQEITHRLHELGLRTGIEIEMVQAGSPCIVRMAGQKLCFRAEDAVSVLVQPIVDAGAVR